MIRINLLGAPKPKGKRASTPAVMEMDLGGGVSPILKIAAVFAIVALANGVYWYRLNNDKNKIQQQMAVAQRKNAELSGVKARYLERQREAENYKRRVDVIDQLRAKQTGPVDLLNTVGSTVNNTEAVWLNWVKDDGGSIDLEGLALSEDAVANLITNLEKTGYFKNVEIKESYQDSSAKDIQAFLFTLSCQKAKS
ncbi:MAG: PilN domain-containing protein [Acidobacteria bacterium]|nr:PilN domain-containing protein [Acidobacteriota bacterium]MBV9479699.1 PilN domain-containing protein [Acidobacteriota bacterium]